MTASATDQYNPIADPAAVVVSGHARFTILTPGVVRMEWSPDGKFEDRASYAFVNRRLPVPRFEQATKDGWLTIDTAALTFRYKLGGRFDKDGLVVRIKKGPKAGTDVRPPFKDDANLGGTARTLDGVSGACPLEPGLLSRNGWTCVDDSQRILFDDKAASPRPQVPGPFSWPWAAPRRDQASGNNPQSAIRNPHSIDWYFFVYGHDYKGALADFIKIAGRIPLPPRFVFGAWWSRYWDYTDAELRQLVEDFKKHGVPLDVLVVDMGWHLEGWTGYTWNPKFFPDPAGFLKWVHEQGLKVTLNLHPAEGVGKQEKAFPEFCRAMGLDPAKVDRVPFDCTDRRYVDAYFRLLHHPLEKMGVDFWWMDYQQQRTTKIPGLDPLPWLNYLHWTDMERRGGTTAATGRQGGTTEGTEDTEKTAGVERSAVGDQRSAGERHGGTQEGSHTDSSVTSASSVADSSSRRPLIFSRWGGLGNHRYPIGFSGDTFCNWQSLAFQPYFTATAGNVGYAYWSHDIGGHQPGPVDPELYVRWIQWGAMSPILRTHTTNNPDAERRIWKFPPEYFEAAKKAYELRYELIPYIYSAARQCYDTGLPLCRPLYYEWPELEEAYTWKGEYMFGDQLLVAPVTEPAEPISGCAMVEVWMPPGEWTNWFTGRTYTGPKVVPLIVPLDEIPLFVKSGGIIVTQPKRMRSDEKPADKLIINIFPAESSEACLCEDDGRSNFYSSGEAEFTPISNTMMDHKRIVTIGPSRASDRETPPQRSYEIRFFDVQAPGPVLVDGRELPGVPIERWEEIPVYYGRKAGRLDIKIPSIPLSRRIDVSVARAPNMTTTSPTAPPPCGVRGYEQLLMDTLTALAPEELPGDRQRPGAWFDAMTSSRSLEEARSRVLKLIVASDRPAETRNRFMIRWLGLHYTLAAHWDLNMPNDLTAVFHLDSVLEKDSLSGFLGKVEFEAESRVRFNRKTWEKKLLGDTLPVDVELPLPFESLHSTTVLRVKIEASREGVKLEIPIEKVLLPSINAWHILGPFDAPIDQALETTFPPEKGIDLKATYDGKGGRKIGWKEYKRQIKPGDDLTGEFFVDFDDVFGQRVYDCVVYGFTYLDAPEDMDAVLRFGTDDGYVLFLNGKEIQRKAIGRPYSSKSDTARVRLKKGRNELLLKVSQGGGDGGFCVHVEDEKGKPLTTVKSRLE